MADHYYSKNPQSEHRPAWVDYAYRGETLRFQTDSGVFSRLEIDQGSHLLLCALPEEISGKVLDLGCGYGVIGLSVQKRYPTCQVLLSDVNQRACQLTRDNARDNGLSVRVLESDGYDALPMERYDYILQNPPIRAGKAVIYAMFAEGANRLNKGGSLWLVIRKQQGAASAMTYLGSLFEQVEAVSKKSGFWVLKCEKPRDSIQTKGEQEP